MSNLTLIAALTAQRVIGRANRLPWHLPADLRFFKQTTMGKPLLLGRRTWESIGRPLPGRTMLILSHDPDYQAAGCQVAHSLPAALSALDNAPEIMVIGGATLYAQTLPYAHRLYLTVIAANLCGDAYFPDWQSDDWHLDWQQAHPADARHAYPYCFQRWERSTPPHPINT